MTFFGHLYFSKREKQFLVFSESQPDSKIYIDLKSLSKSGEYAFLMEGDMAEFDLYVNPDSTGPESFIARNLVVVKRDPFFIASKRSA